MQRSARTWIGVCVGLAPWLVCDTARAGPMLEVELTVSGPYFNWVFGKWDSQHHSMRAVFDAGAPPTFVSGDAITFSSVSARYSIGHRFAPGAVSDVPFSTEGVLLPGREVIVLPSAATITYLIAENEISLTVISPDGKAGVAILEIDAHPAFFPGMTSLPDAPEDYGTANPETDLIVGTGSDGTSPVVARWPNGVNTSVSNALAWSVRVLPDPEPCLPDLAEPFGVLDFSDVLAFLSAFAAGCP